MRGAYSEDFQCSGSWAGVPGENDGVCMASDQSFALRDASPTLSGVGQYCDPVTLELPNSHMAFSLARRVNIDDVGGFEERFSLLGQGLDLSYRLRIAGYSLMRVGSSGDFEQTKSPKILRQPA